jgi:anti-sigma factor RsiW
MSCQTITRMLSAFQDGELEPPRRREVERHLHDCAACRRELDGLRELERRLRLEPAPAADPFFTGRVMANLRPLPAARRRWLPAAAYALVFAAVFLAGFALQTATAAPAAASATFSSVLAEPQQLGLLAVQDDTMRLFSGERR